MEWRNGKEKIIQEMVQDILNVTSFLLHLSNTYPMIMDEIRSILRQVHYWSFRTSKTRKKPLVSREEWLVSCKGSRIRLGSDFWTTTLETRRWWSKVFKILRENNFQCKILYLSKLSIACEVRLKHFQICEFSKILPHIHPLSGDYWKKLRKNEDINQERCSLRNKEANKQRVKGVPRIGGKRNHKATAVQQPRGEPAQIRVGQRLLGKSLWGNEISRIADVLEYIKT